MSHHPVAAASLPRVLRDFSWARGVGPGHSDKGRAGAVQMRAYPPRGMAGSDPAGTLVYTEPVTVSEWIQLGRCMSGQCVDSESQWMWT